MKKKTISWKRQLEDFAKLFNFKIDLRVIHTYSYPIGNKTMLCLTYGKSIVQIRTKAWRDGFDNLAELCERTVDIPNACHKLMQKLSGATIVWRWSEKREDTFLGFTNVRKERHVTLPEFDIIEELKLKLSVMGVV